MDGPGFPIDAGGVEFTISAVDLNLAPPIFKIGDRLILTLAGTDRATHLEVTRVELTTHRPAKLVVWDKGFREVASEYEVTLKVVA